MQSDKTLYNKMLIGISYNFFFLCFDSENSVFYTMLIPVTVGVVQAETVQVQETEIQIHRAETEIINKEEIQIHNETKIQIRNLQQRIQKQKNGIKLKDSVNVPKRQRQNLQNSKQSEQSTSQRLTQKRIRTDRKNVNGKSKVKHKNFYRNNSRS